MNPRVRKVPDEPNAIELFSGTNALPGCSDTL
jgi:hypothetical protein